MPQSFPHRFEVELGASDIAQATATTASGHASPFVTGPPPAFGGSDAWWSPEQLQLAALGGCHMTTFLAIARHSKLPVHDYHCQVEGCVDKTSDGFRFTSFTIHVEVRVDEADRQRTERVLDKAEAHCIISNALRVPVEVEALVQTVGAPAQRSA